jgi:predicted AAA+ superfamily ATPase
LSAPWRFFPFKRKIPYITFLVNKEQLKYIYTEAEGRSLPRLIPREVEVPLGSGKVVVLTGIRRSGKTSLLYEAMGRLLAWRFLSGASLQP